MSIYSKVCGGGGSDASRGSSSSLGTTHFRDFSDSTLESGYLIVSVSPLFLALFSLEYVSLCLSLPFDSASKVNPCSVPNHSLSEKPHFDYLPHRFLGHTI